jgi:DNA-binding MarR family transcriptional regulator
MRPRSNRPFQDRCAAVGATCACFAIRRASRAVTQLYDEVLQPSRLRVTQFTVLVALSLAGPVPITRLGDRLVMDRTTLTRNLRPLQKQGWIATAPGEDGRVRVVTLTTQGERALAKALPLWRQAQARIVGRLGAGRLARLQGDLSELVALARRG